MDSSAEAMKKATHLNLQVDVHPADQPAFCKKYTEETGKKATRLFPRSKRGSQFAIFFKAPELTAQNLRMLGFTVTDCQRGEFNYAVEGSSAERLFWKLSRNGFPIGESVPTESEVLTPC
jgi:hypothetical protein